jgi:hypothetical protein
MGAPNVVIFCKFFGDRVGHTIEWDRKTNVAEEFLPAFPTRWEAMVSLNGDELTIVIPKGDPKDYDKQGWLLPIIFKGKKCITENGSVIFVGFETNLTGEKTDSTVRVISGML